MAVGSISWPELAEWRRVTGNVLGPWELRVIRALEAERVGWLRKPESERKKMIPATAQNLAQAFRSLISKPNRQTRKQKREAKNG